MNSTEYFRHLKSLLTQRELEQLLDDPASLESAPDEEDDTIVPTESIHMGAGPFTGTGRANDDVPRSQPLHDTVRKFERDEDLTFDEVFRAEAIILPLMRPAILVRRNDYTVKHQKWLHLNDDGSDARTSILSAIPSIGRINVPSNAAIPYAGTGFIVGENLLMTNRHVAELFADGLGQGDVSLKPGASVNIDFKAEHRSFKKLRLQVEGVRMIHPFWDMALLEVDGIPKNANILQLSQIAPQALNRNEIAVIGYPAFDPRDDKRDVQHRLFNQIYNVKRVQPGFYKARSKARSFGHPVDAVGHDASTLNGSSGSAVIDLETGHVVGLHFGGIFGKLNYAVPTCDLARDPYVIRAGVNFAGKAPRAKSSPWAQYWRQTAKIETAPDVNFTDSNDTGLQVTSHTRGENRTEIVINVPVKLSVGFDLSDIQRGTSHVAQPSTEKMIEPIHDSKYGARQGYDPDFLGLPVPMPQAINDDDLSIQHTGETVLKYHNFSIVMNARRRLAQITACTIDTSDIAKEPEVGFLYTRRSLNGFSHTNDREKWFLDPRIPSHHQLPDRFYNSDRTAFDKGHLVRRAAVAFGDSFESVQLANGDSFHSTNCSPQVKGFNRSNLQGLWGRLENDILSSANATRCVVFSGPVFDQSDPEFHGRDLGGDTIVQIPARYWKMVITSDGTTLQSFAYLLEQDLDDVIFEFAKAGEWRDHEIDPHELEIILGNVLFPHLETTPEEKISAAEWSELVQDPETTEEEITEVSVIHQGIGAFDFRIAPNPAFVDLPPGAAETENAMAIGNDLGRSRRKIKFELRTAFGSKLPVLVSEMDSWGQFPLLIREIVDHLNKDYNVWSVGAAGDTAQNMVLGPIEPRATEYMLALNEQRGRVKGFVFSAAGNDIIGADPDTGKPVITDLLRPFNGDTTDIKGHINQALLSEKINFLRGIYKKVISDIRSDADFKKLPIFIHGYDYPFPYPWVNDNRHPIHAAKDKWLGSAFMKRGITDRNLRRKILMVLIDRLYDMLSEFSGNSATTKVWLVDCRNAMPSVSDWIDEIHGTSAGFRKVTKRFKSAMNEAGI